VQRATYSHLYSIHRDMRVGLWNCIWLPGRDGPILVFTARSLRSCTGTVHTIAPSLHESPLAIESLLKSLLEWLLGSLYERAAFERAAFERAAFERPALREE